MEAENVSVPRCWRDNRSLKVLGMGTALPGPPVSTAELLECIENRFRVPVRRRGAILAERLGIATRHICRDFSTRHETPRPNQSNPDLAASALRAAMQEAGLEANDLAYVIGHTATPACLVPSNTAFVSDRIGFSGPYMELRQACTGFANALVIAQGLLAAPGAKPVAIVGSETGSVYFDPCRASEDTTQLVNLVQMGDAAAAIILGPEDNAPGARIRNNFFGQIGTGRTPGLTLATGGSDHAFVEGGMLEFAHDCVAVKTSGPELFERGVAVAYELGVAVHSVDYVIPHQANGHMAKLLGPFLGIEPHHIFVNADRVGNTGSTAIWLALAELRAQLKPGTTVLTLGAEATKYMFGGFLYSHG